MADDLKPGAEEAITDVEVTVDTTPPSGGTAIEPAERAAHRADRRRDARRAGAVPGEAVDRVAPASSAGSRRAYGVVAAIFVIGALGTVMAVSGLPARRARQVVVVQADRRPAREGAGHRRATSRPGYKLDDQQQMVVVSARDAGVGSQQIQFVAVPGQEQYDIINGANTVAYEMCGLGEHCSISTGQPSTDRDRLLRREALEIALYTFKYVGDTDAVVVFMPPPVGATTSWALLFKKQNYGAELGQPITKTLPSRRRTRPASRRRRERDLVEQLTGNARYSYKVQDVNGAPVLVLDAPAT